MANGSNFSLLTNDLFALPSPRSEDMFAHSQKRPGTASRQDRKRARPGNANPGVSGIGPAAKVRPITIAYRECANGAGAFWDHYTIQHLTNRRTIASHSGNVTPVIDYQMEAHTGHYRGRLVENPRTMTGVGRGLLVLTGGNFGLDLECPRDKAHVPRNATALARHRNRQIHERQLLQQAYRMGRPVLGICGGSWTVLESYGGATTSVAARTHQARRSPFIRTDGRISSNFAEHDIEIFGNADQPTLLAHINQDQSQQLRNIRRTIDSSHWAAAREDNVLTGQIHTITQRPARPDEVGPHAADMHAARERLEAKLRLLVVAARDAGVTRRRVLPVRESTRTIEAFETRYGAPVAGVQWHPERYAVGQDHKDAAAMSKALLREMAKAGDAYEARRQMTADFQLRMNNARQAGPDPEVRRVFGLRPARRPAR